MPSQATEAILLPGQEVLQSALPLPQSSSASLKLGPGLTHKLPSEVTAQVAGTLHIDKRKHAVWVENNTGRYNPRPNDLVLATIERSVGEAFQCRINPFSPPAQLPHMAFENVTKKTRPHFANGTLVYARVVSSVVHNKFQEPELACVNPTTGKSDGLGELKGGMVFEVSLEMGRRLLLAKAQDDGGVGVLDALARLWPFEVAVGRNGRVWVEAQDVKRTLLVGRCLKEVDRKGFRLAEQERLVKRLQKEMDVD